MILSIDPINVFLQIIATDVTIDLDVWYNVTIRGLAQGRTGYALEINGNRAMTVDEDFTEFSLDSLNGMLYIGGHPNLMAIEVSNYTERLITA